MHRERNLPLTLLAELTLFAQEDIRGAISIFEGRVQSWPKAHPVQSQLCEGLSSLEKLAT